jgi:hypothetical protein
MATRDLARLGARVKAHRVQKYSGRKQAADAGGITKDTWQRIEEGRPARDGSYLGVERALDWAVGSCVTIAEGGEPVLVEAVNGTTSAITPTPTGRLSAEVVRKAAYEAVRSTMPGAPISEADAFVDELVDVLRKAGEVDDD